MQGIGRHLGGNHSVISRLVRKYQQTNDVKEPPRTSKTSPGEDRTSLRLAQHCPFPAASAYEISRFQTGPFQRELYGIGIVTGTSKMASRIVHK